MYKDLDSFIKCEQDPDISYFVIRQSLDNIKKGITISIPTEKEDKISLMRKLDIFKGVMQYIEEFGLYFLAYLDKNTDISEKIIRTEPKDVKAIFQRFNDKMHNDFANSKDYSSYDELLADLFNIPDSKGSADDERKNSIKNLRYAIDKMAWFYIFYSDLYNAIKHGFRVFKGQYERIEIRNNEDNVIHSIELNEEYFDAVCKEEVSGKKYILMYPANALLENSIRVLEDAHEVFNYLRKTNKYEKLPYFQHNVLNNFLNYTRSYNDTYAIYLPKSEELEKRYGSTPEIKHAKMLVKDKKIEFHLSDVESIEYPFTIKWGSDYGHHPRPGIKSDLNISASLNMDIEQYQNLIKIEKLANMPFDELEIIFKDENGKKITKMKYGDLNFPKLPGKCNENTINFLVLLKKITNKEMPVPLDLSNKQREIINSNINHKFSSQTEAIKLLDEIKKHNFDLASFFIRLIDDEDNEISRKHIGSTMNMDLMGVTEIKNSSREHMNIKDLEGKGNFKDLSIENPDKFIKYLESSLNPIGKKEEVESEYDNEFGILIKIELEEEYWHNNYNVEMTLKIKS